MACCRKHGRLHPAEPVVLPTWRRMANGAVAEPQCLECAEKHIGVAMVLMHGNRLLEARWRMEDKLRMEPRDVESMIGEAMELADEACDGYHNYLRIVGCLRLAELHTRQWPSLSEAIREERRRYQSNERKLDWDRVCREMVLAKQSHQQPQEAGHE